MTKDELKLIKDAFRLVITEENKAIDKVIASSPVPSERIYQRCDEKAREIIDEQKKSLPARKILTVLIAATLIISLLVVVTYAARDKIGGFFVDFFEKYTKLTSENTEDNNYTPSDISITYLPEGYNETRKNTGIASALYEWKNSEKIITLQFRIFSDGSQAVDTENSENTMVDVGAYTVFKTEKHGYISATWTDEKMVYILSATGVEWDEMVKIIEGIKIEE
jgi:predicted nucleic acid-binding Zn ribbon protein